MNLSIMVKNYKGKVCNMYQDEYKRWLAADLEDADLKPELARIEGNDDEIKDRFAVALKFGTAGLRGVLGAGTNRMNIYVVRQATQGLANWVKTQGGNQTVAISYDSRLKSDVFAKTAAGVLAANGIKVRIYDALMPVPALSFATRYYECNAGIMVTASHNPAKYNGYKAYGPDGCQMTDDAAAIVYDEIQKTDVLTGAKYISFAEGVEQGLIRFVGDDCKNALYAAIEARQVRPGLCKTAGLKLVYSPLNGSGLVPVTHVLNDMGITDIVRGRDLLRSNALQIYIRKALINAGFKPSEPTQPFHPADGSNKPDDVTISYAHLPLIDNAAGQRLAKRERSLDLGILTAHGATAQQIIGYCAWLLGLQGDLKHTKPQPMSADEALGVFSWDAVRTNTSDRTLDQGEFNAYFGL